MSACLGCGNMTAQRVWTLACCLRCFGELAMAKRSDAKPVWPDSGDMEAKYPVDEERHEAYRKLAQAWLEKRKARAA